MKKEIKLLNLKDNKAIAYMSFGNMMVVDIKYVGEYVEHLKRGRIIDKELKLMSDKEKEIITADDFIKIVNKKLEVYRPKNKLSKTTSKLIYRIRAFGGANHESIAKCS